MISLYSMQEKWMKLALEEARKAYERDEVPVGAVLVSDKGELISQAHNKKEADHNPCGHAELLALQKASDKLKSWRLSELTMYVTLEPCMMCTGALIQARIKKVVYGASDPKGGFVESLERGFDIPKLNHKVIYESGVLKEECSQVLKDFFKQKRGLLK